MGVVEIQAGSFDEVVKASGRPVVLEFWVRSCDKCRKFKPVYEKLPEVFGDGVRFLRINMMNSIENLRLAEDMGVEQTPTTKVFCSGKEIGEIVGYKPLGGAVEKIKSILGSSKDCGP